MSRDQHDHGLRADLRALSALIDRRRALQILAGSSLIPIFGCASGSASGIDSAGALSDLGGNPGSCAALPEETGGPYPGDGTNGPNVLTASGIVRSDIRSSFGGMTGTAAGVPLTFKLTLVNTAASCAPLAGYAIYLWHCDRDGLYSLYTMANQNYLRGVQETDAAGGVTFTSIFPGCYSGRWPHVHFEIYQSLAKAMSAGNRVKTSQLALPEAPCKVVFATTGYAQSVTNLAQTSLSGDMVFADGSSLQLASVTGDVATGYVASLTMGLPA